MRGRLGLGQADGAVNGEVLDLGAAGLEGLGEVGAGLLAADSENLATREVLRQAARRPLAEKSRSGISVSMCR